MTIQVSEHGQAGVVLSPSEYDRVTGELALQEALGRAERAEAEVQVVAHDEALDRFKAVVASRGRP